LILAIKKTDVTQCAPDPSRRAALGPIGPPPCLCEVALHGANLYVVDADVHLTFPFSISENFKIQRGRFSVFRIQKIQWPVGFYFSQAKIGRWRASFQQTLTNLCSTKWRRSSDTGAAVSNDAARCCDSSRRTCARPACRARRSSVAANIATSNHQSGQSRKRTTAAKASCSRSPRLPSASLLLDALDPDYAEAGVLTANVRDILPLFIFECLDRVHVAEL
jgi:hypothetical protein